MVHESRIALVTGAARGIGYAIAFVLANKGMMVVVADIDEGGARMAASEIRSGGAAAESVHVDVSDVGRVMRVIEDLAARFGRVDVLVNNAGILSNTSYDAIDRDEWDRVMAINVRGPMFASREALRHMCAHGWGRIVNVSSLAGRNGGVSVGPAYAASKAALIGMTRCLAGKVAGYGITVNAVAPGTTQTEAVKQFSEDEMTAIRRSIPAGRLGRPEEIAETVAFLASDAAAFITGAVIDINGGMFTG
jgi:3-oxoacyl-[acyl-carrier protein] reductase